MNIIYIFRIKQKNISAHMFFFFKINGFIYLNCLFIFLPLRMKIILKLDVLASCLLFFNLYSLKNRM
jgi:hypothetical protein